MKLRILGDSFRFRITTDELERLRKTGSLQTTSRFPGDGEDVAFTFGIRVETAASESRLKADAGVLQLCLSENDLQALLAPENEGVHLKRQWRDAAGRMRRAMAIVEKDRKPSQGHGSEAWIYGDDEAESESVPGGGPSDA